MRVALHHIEDVAANIKTLWFKPEQPIRYVAGQFTELHLPHQDADDRGVRRWFTLSSSPTEDLLGITTRFEPGRSSSFKRQLAALQPGTTMHLADPMGDFVLPKDPSIPLLFVAAGLGITPVRSMVKWLLDTNERRNIQLLYAVSGAEELAFEPLFKEYNLSFAPVITKQHGRLTADHILELAQGGEPLIYLSGPEIMIETFYKGLQTKGFAAERLVADYFPGYTKQ